ncbi:MAG: 23S rRNA (guanosine(2251)-2'-O)-methyltransferase RlmB [Acidobacteria bacterium]|nr:23S rRNA (guanosine(2251)-2'-O)-methyltransferase RlmB [Acidobacteriota bacterium]MCA1608237.1 23S rRNA (guanosine(2251)-2'-O)-methyltransferase RlmB [Acidobacteriota bacterium]
MKRDQHRFSGDRDDKKPVRRELPGGGKAVLVSQSLIYGVGPVLEALRANARRIDKIFAAEGARARRLHEIFGLAAKNGIVVNRVSRADIERIVGTEASHQGIIAFRAAADYVAADEIIQAAGEATLLLLLDGIEDPRNFGAILRTAECAGVDGVFIPERRAVGLNETVAKSSAGAAEHVKVAKVQNFNRLIENLKSQDIWVVGASGTARMKYSDWDWTRPTALVLGGEGKGLHRLVAENCDELVKIPMCGKIESLNVSVAAGVILFEARRQRDVKL